MTETTAPTDTVLGSLRILRAMAELTKTQAREALSPQVATDALDDTIDALSSAIGVLEQHSAVTARAVDVVHNHAPYRPMCNERRLASGTLRGACLPDDLTGGAE
jgi:hypothetical protein